MISGTLEQAAEMMQGRLIGENRRYLGVSSDTRTLREDELFVALDGPNFRGSSFLPAAREKRAAGAVLAGQDGDVLPCIVVDDARQALGRLGAAWRQTLSPRTVGLTGSNGKTTLKEMVASCLRQVGDTLATEGNLNNDIGVPLMLCRLSPDHEYAVIEMGANHAGEICYLTGLVAPEVVAISNAGAAHLEGFGSIAGVAHAKGEILQGSPPPEAAILNADDPYFDLWRGWAEKSRVLSFGVLNEADVRAVNIQVDAAGSRFTLELPENSIDVRLALSGSHNVLNAAAAAAIAVALDVPPECIRSGLDAVRPVAGRLRRISAVNGSCVFDDSYNANPDSVTAAAQFLASQPGKSWFVLGDMAELGVEAGRLHAECGAAIRLAGVDRLFATGPLSRNAVEGFGEGACWYADVDALIGELSDALQADGPASVLVKGSRSSRMERVVDALPSSAQEAVGC